MILAANGSFTLAPGSAPIVVSGLSFQPKVIFFNWGGLTTSFARQDAFYGHGVAVSPSSRVCVAASAFNEESAAWAQHGYSEHDVIFVLGFLGGHTIRADITAIASDGFTIEPRHASPFSVLVNYLAWGGSDITDVAIGNFFNPTALGNQDVTVGFRPDMLMTLHTGINNITLPIAASVGSEISLGFAAGENLAQGAWNGKNYRQLGNIVSRSYCRRDAAFIIQELLASVPVVEARGRVTSWLSDGFRVNWAKSAGSYRLYYLAIKGGDWGVFSFLTRTDTNLFDIMTSRGFPRLPTSTLFMSAGNPESTLDVPDTHMRSSIGTVTSISEKFVHAVVDRNGVDPSEIGVGGLNGGIYKRLNPVPSLSEDGIVNIVGIDYGKYIGQMSQVDNAENIVIYLATGGELKPKPAELDLAQPIGGIPVGMAFEIDTAFGLAPPGRPVMTDSTVVVTVTTPTTTITGLGHLEGALVCAVIDGNCNDTTYTVADGQITLVEAAQHRVEVGLCYDAELWTMRPAVPGVPVNGLPRHWTKLGLRVRKSHGGLVGFGSADPSIPIRVGDRSYPSNMLPGELFTGDIDLTGYGETELDGRIKIKVPGPCPFTLLALFGEVEFGAHA